ncbi:hypothetical protein EJB05_43328 [Eragrostis curvula]|uniref:Uncharacterized protein n=1 Tax=Eragrostis curvula TaxID=38414 RepID=A0A5J9SNU5_9POAL|nr:hypothetical protein EJB05_53978 [Eragrostis curvula]TVU09832.1 hypothetical protein EJB05_43328 [Eragrostis curvula]
MVTWKNVPVTVTNPSGDTNKDALAAAVHASGKIENGIHTLKKETKQRHLLVVVSLLLAAVTPFVLWRSRGDQLLVVWRLAFLLCFVSSMRTYFLTRTMDVHVFLYNSFGILLAFFADTVLSPSIGALIAHFNTHFAAGLLGYALAEHRQNEGSEVSAAHVPGTAKEEEEEFKLLLLWILAGLIASVPSLAILAGLQWLVWHAGEYRIEKLVPMTLFLLSVASVLGIFFVAVMQLRGSLISPLGFVLISAYLAVVFLFHLCSSLILGDVAAMVITWVACLGLTGLFGYCLSVLATFKQIKRTRESSELQSKHRSPPVLA